jgi:hypothetical protein
VSEELNDKGENGDAVAGDGVYSGRWNPPSVGVQKLFFTSSGGGAAASADREVEAVGSIEFAPAPPCALGMLRGRTEGKTSLDLSASRVHGFVDVELRSASSLAGIAFEIDPGTGWQTVGAAPLRLRVSDGEPRVWPVRVRAGNCPSAVTAGDRGIQPFELTATDANGKPVRLEIPVQMEIVADPWLHCWWPFIGAGTGVLLVLFLLHGFLSASRFTARSGIVISTEEDIDSEGFFYPFRGQPGSRSGFYRDAVLYLGQDYRVSRSRSNSLVRIRASGRNVRLRPSGAAVYQLTTDGDWQEMAHEETIARNGVRYRNDGGSLYFEFRNC